MDLRYDVTVLRELVVKLENDGLDIQKDGFQLGKDGNNELFSLNSCKSS